MAAELRAVLKSATKYDEHHFKRMKEDADKLGVDVTRHVRSDTIVMGHRGESLLQKGMVGSVAKRVKS